MKKLFKMTCAAMMAATMVGCGASASDENTIMIGISPDYAPYESIDAKTKEMVGFDVDMIAWFEDYLSETEGVDYNLEFKQMNFDNIITQLQGDQVDLGVAGFSYDEDRKVEWSEPYLGSSQVAVVPAGSAITSLSDLAGKKIGVQSGSTGESAAKEIEGADVAPLKAVTDLMSGLAANQFDVVVIDLGVAKNYVANGNFALIEGELANEKNYIIAKDGNTEVMEKVNKCIKAFVESDDYAKLCKEYGLTPLTK